METMQFTAIVLMTLLTLKLLLLPGRVAANAVVNKSRWLMASGTALLGVQFLLQYSLSLRTLGITQAVMVNLVFFIPCSYMISMAVLYLQRQGRINRIDKLVGVLTWIAVMTIMCLAAAVDGKLLMSNTPELRNAEVVGSCLYAAMQGHYTWKLTKNLRAMHHALHNYYDRDMDSILRWMQMSVIILAVLALMVPMLIFVKSKLLGLFGLLFFCGTFYLVDSFCSYVVSFAPARVQAAEKNEELNANIRSDETDECDGHDAMMRVEQAVELWLGEGKHLKSGMKLPSAAKSIGVPQYLLSAWLRNNDLKYSDWMTNMRIDEAKHVMKTHPEWSNEAIAQHCGFSDRSYFHKKFKEVTGMSPTDWQADMMK